MTKTAQKRTTRRMGRPTAEESKRREEQLKDAAYRLFLEKGFDGVTMEAIAGAAGITKRTLYAKYSDKAELFSVVLRDMKNRGPMSRLTPAIPENGSLADRLSRAADALMAQVLDPETVKMARMASAKAEEFSEDIRTGFSMARDPRLHVVIKILRSHADEIEKKFLDDEAKTAELFVGMIIGIPARLAGFGTVRDPEFEQERIRLAVDLFVAGICKRSG